ncbi:MAG: helix-turn-helix domain-containing protein [Patescibacteria group bacterium]|nr:helix-turn-helix domain-containing protein [Patescibacteria group bacterium]MBU1160835.1 helix-turn-helix domain-containing protein [Patescibacteria group bacterium]MBU1684194.1 helix-turn-helix domain-containing protein [Patescibacteria group bacterium]MBU1778448.1 helix-turn-helix domain-containing protein [Patescibacteria group bacterium]MBU1987187.1 helix-turn-helix domain-containing protein [Patescibacteria group bacterium]
MFQFKSNAILSKMESIAEQLRNARRAKNLCLETIARELNINYKYLKALENGNYDELPAGTYKKSFLKKYSSYLGLDYNDFDNLSKIDGNRKHHNFFSQQIAKVSYFFNIPKIAKSIIAIIITCVFFTYLGFYLKKTTLPPELYIIKPTNNLILQDNFLDIIGKTEPEAQVAINGEMILIDNSGMFKENISLKQGVNTIVITAQKKYGSKKIVKRQVLIQ